MIPPPDEKRCTARTKAGERCRQHRYEPEELCRTHMPDDKPEPPPRLDIGKRHLVVAHAPPDAGMRCGSCRGQGELPQHSVGIFEVPDDEPRDEEPLCRRCLEDDLAGRVLSHYLKLWSRVVRDLDAQTCDRLQAFVTGELDADGLASRPRTEW